MIEKDFKVMDVKLRTEFHPSLNNDLRTESVCATSTLPVWWLTDGMAWLASPYQRSRGIGSPFQVVKK